MNLVTGATGQLGSHVVFELALAGKPVRALYRNIDKVENVRKIFEFYNKDAESLFHHIEWIKADINDYHALSECMVGIDMVFHTAGWVSFDEREKRKLFYINASGTTNVVNACLEAGNIRLLHVSSIATLGELSTNDPVDESILWNQGTSASAYSMSKYRGEMEVWRGIFEGLDAAIVNPSVIIGPAMHLGPAKQLFTSIRDGLKFYTVGSSGYVDVRDVARIMVLLSTASVSGERFIISCGNIQHRKILDLLSERLNKPLPKYRLTPFIARTAVILESFRSFFTNSSPRITMQTIHTAGENLKYSNLKIRNFLNVDFIPPEQSIRDAVDFYKFLTEYRVTI
jgi:nucleoside-diphosphate-sugar epimerase